MSVMAFSRRCTVERMTNRAKHPRNSMTALETMRGSPNTNELGPALRLVCPL